MRRDLTGGEAAARIDRHRAEKEQTRAGTAPTGVQHAIVLRGCIVRVYPAARYLETIYPDGSMLPAAPHDTDAYRQTARACGYGVDTWALCREHELLHSLLAEERDLCQSPTLWDVAHGVAPDAAQLAVHHREESEVLALQLYANTGDTNIDPHGVLSALAMEFDLVRFRARVLALRAFSASSRP